MTKFSTMAFAAANEGNGAYGDGSPAREVKTAVIPVGGLGTRMFPQTFAVPKNLLSVGTKTLIQYAAEEALNAGCENIVVVCSPEHIDQYKQAFGELTNAQKAKLDGKPALQDASADVLNLAAHIKFVEQTTAEGLGHAIYQAKDYIDGPFAVILPDDLIIDGELQPSALADMVESYKGGIAVARQRVGDHEIKDYGSFAFNDGADLEADAVEATGMVEKQGPDTAPSREAVIGRYILTPSVFQHLEADIVGDRRNEGGEFDITAPIAAACRNGEKLFASRYSGTRFDCGKPEGYEDAQYYVAGISKALRDMEPDMTEEPVAEIPQYAS